MRESLECGSSPTFQDYYEWAARNVRWEALSGNFQHFVEFGAGTAPIACHLARLPDPDDLEIIVCESHPEAETYRALERQYPGPIRAIYEFVDFTQPHAWPPGTLLVLAGAFHHIPPSLWRQVLQLHSSTAARVMVVEPVRKTFLSGLFGVSSPTSSL